MASVIPNCCPLDVVTAGYGGLVLTLRMGRPGGFDPACQGVREARPWWRRTGHTAG